MKHQHGRESAGMIFIARFMNSFCSGVVRHGYWCYDRHRWQPGMVELNHDVKSLAMDQRIA
jgi:hypothetical protein